jgi:hypothetical protein
MSFDPPYGDREVFAFYVKVNLFHKVSINTTNCYLFPFIKGIGKRKMVSNNSNNRERLQKEEEEGEGIVLRTWDGLNGAGKVG